MVHMGRAYNHACGRSLVRGGSESDRVIIAWGMEMWPERKIIYDVA